MELKYDVEADWMLLTSCNFRCRYCFVPLNDLAAKITTYATHAEWADGFEATRKTWLLHLSGGEPSIYPGFVDLCEKLTKRHYLSINTNLSHPCFEAFADRINPQRVHFINAAVHYDARPSQRSLDAFIRRTQKLTEHRFHVLISLVMTPVMVQKYPEISAYFETQGLALIPKVLRDGFDGRLYPEAYTSEEKSLIREYSAKARHDYASATEEMGQTPTINVLGDDALLERSLLHLGKLCGSGHSFVRIEPDGTVTRCGSGLRLGNILLKDVALLDAPKPCDSIYCPYFCEKYTAPPFVPALQNKRDLDDIFSKLKNFRDSKRQSSTQ